MGYGDEILTTGYIKEFKKKYPCHQIVIGDPKKKLIYYSDIFKNNPLITTSKEFDYTNHPFASGWGPVLPSWTRIIGLSLRAEGP